jgi:hypothetical protein
MQPSSQQGYLTVLLNTDIVCLHLYCRLRSNYQEGICWNHNKLFNPTTIVCLSEERSWILTSHVVVFFMFNDLRRAVIACFVDIDGILDHRCLIKT